MGKKALLVVSFGTSFEEALPAIVNIEETCKKAFPDYDFYRAFTSGMIIRKWARTKNVIIHNPDEVMKRLVAEGYEEVICQPTHIINGLEYDKMMNMLLAYKDQIPTIKVGTPPIALSLNACTFTGQSETSNMVDESVSVDQGGQVIRVDIPNGDGTFTTLEGEEAQKWYDKAGEEDQQEAAEEASTQSIEAVK